MRQRVGRRRRGVEGDVALDLLHELVDVSVEDGDRTEAPHEAEGGGGVVGAPAPVGVHGEERDVAEDHQRRLALHPLEVAFEPRQLVGAQVAELLEIDGVHQGDEVRAPMVEAEPAVALGAGPEELPVLLAGVVGGVVLAGQDQDLARPQRGEHLLDLVELFVGRVVGQVTGVDDEIGPGREPVDEVDGALEGLGDVGIGGAGEADVAVGDLHEAEVLGLGRRAPVVEDVARHHPAGDGDGHRRTGPRRVAQETAAAELAVEGVVGVGGVHAVTSTEPCMNGWMPQL